MRKSNLAIIIAVIAVSFSSIFIRWSDAEPLAIAFYRLLFTTLLLLPFVLTRQREEFKNLEKKNILLMLGIGLILSFHFSMWITSLGLTTVASSVILVTAHPILVGSVSHFVMKDKLSRLNFIGIFVAIAGIILLTMGDFSGGPLTGSKTLGNILAFLAGICAGIYILGGRKMRRSISVVTYAFLVYLFCTIFLFIQCMITSTKIFPLPANEYYLFLLMALVPGILGHTLYNWSLKHVTATVVSVSLLGEPIGSSILAVLLLNEIPSGYVLIGGPIVLAGILLASMKARKKKRKKCECRDLNPSN
ncbi:MAG: DMT family transporter [Thermoplasmata archaeon]|nr:DMT family transporter [Thermoplasmata archaeon]